MEEILITDKIRIVLCKFLGEDPEDHIGIPNVPGSMSTYGRSVYLRDTPFTQSFLKWSKIQRSIP